jgi:hypothetical protein
MYAVIDQPQQADSPITDITEFAEKCSVFWGHKVVHCDWHGISVSVPTLRIEGTPPASVLRERIRDLADHVKRNTDKTVSIVSSEAHPRWECILQSNECCRRSIIGKEPHEDLVLVIEDGLCVVEDTDAGMQLLPRCLHGCLKTYTRPSAAQ